MPTSVSDGQYREILARLEGLGLRVTEIREDAREARDAATKLTERFDAQDVPKQITDLRADMERGLTGLRQDLVNAATRVRHDLDLHDTRLKKLEAFQNRIEGAGGALAWISKNAPWLLTIAFAIAAAVGLKDRLP